jgi:transcriptional regulator with XRE-family HTH domain
MDSIHKCLYDGRMALGKNVKLLREARGLTYEAVGKAVGTDGQNIFNLEKRGSKVSKFAPALAQFFGVDLEVLTTKDLSYLSPEALRDFGRNEAHQESGEYEVSQVNKVSKTAMRVAVAFDQLESVQKKIILQALGLEIIGPATDKSIVDEEEELKDGNQERQSN